MTERKARRVDPPCSMKGGFGRLSAFAKYTMNKRTIGIIGTLLIHIVLPIYLLWPRTLPPPPPPKSAPTIPKAWPFTLPADVRGPNPKMDQFMTTVNGSQKYSAPIAAAAVSATLKKEPKMAVNYSAEPFTNHLGQVIQVGQKVICVSQGYNHTTKVSLGTYLGLRRDSRGNVRNVVVMRTIEKYGYQLNGKSASYKTPGASYGKFTHTGKTSLPSKRIYPTV
jgi:hypothetical protein